MLGLVFCISISPREWTALGCALFFLILWVSLFLPSRGDHHYYFDSQDFLKFENGGNRKLPVSAETGTFISLLKGYVGATKLLITVAAASIAFGTNHSAPLGVALAKIILAYSVLYGTVFVALLQFFYEQYAQDVTCYRPWRYSLIQALGFSALPMFALGYVVWAFNLA
ncbi:MAG: hypothetical protein ACLGSD_00870 [Acidobacteriota bacterium]